MDYLKKKRHKILYKKFLVLKTNVNNNNKIFKFKKKKWEEFLTILKKKKKMKVKLKPFSTDDYIVSKFASQGNSFKKKFKNDLIAKKTFNYFYGNLMKKYLKKSMNNIYHSKKSYSYKLVCLKFFESRLDSVLYRSKFCFSIKNAKHLISHKHITVNNSLKKSKSYSLRQGDLIGIRKDSLNLVKINLIRIIIENIKTRQNFTLHLSQALILAKIRNRFMPFRFKRELERFTNLFSSAWPIPPKFLIINYKTLEIIFDDIQTFNFSIYFPFKLDIHSIITNYYRH